MDGSANRGRGLPARRNACELAPFPGEPPAAHLRGRVRPRRPRVHRLAAELHHVGAAAAAGAQVGEEGRRPVPDQRARRAQLQPPVALLRVLPDEQGDVELVAAVGRDRRDGGADRHAGVGLHEARAVQVVAPRLLVRVVLQSHFTTELTLCFSLLKFMDEHSKIKTKTSFSEFSSGEVSLQSSR